MKEHLDDAIERAESTHKYYENLYRLSLRDEDAIYTQGVALGRLVVQTALFDELHHLRRVLEEGDK